MKVSTKWRGSQPPQWVSKVATVFVIAGILEVARLTVTVAYSALQS